MDVKDIFNKCKESGVEIDFNYFSNFNWFRVRVVSRDIFKQTYMSERIFLPEEIENDVIVNGVIALLIDEVIRNSQK